MGAAVTQPHGMGQGVNTNSVNMPPGSILWLGDNRTLIACALCGDRKPFRAVFHGRRVCPRTGEPVRMSPNHLPNDPYSMSEAEARVNYDSVAAYQRHFRLEHKGVEYTVRGLTAHIARTAQYRNRYVCCTGIVMSALKP